MWNYFSLAKWMYDVPWVGRAKLFEMPVLGFAGYLPFGWECAALGDWAGRPAAAAHRRARRVNLFLHYAWDNTFFFGAWVIIIAFSICVHEYAHARVALLFGDDTRRGTRATLNAQSVKADGADRAHRTAGPSASRWGAVPVDPRRLRTRLAAATVAVRRAGGQPAAGGDQRPALAVARCGPIYSMAKPGTSRSFSMLLPCANSTLFLFNLLPVPILDGWCVGRAVLPGDAEDQRRCGAKYLLDSPRCVDRHPGGQLYLEPRRTVGQPVSCAWPPRFSATADTRRCGKLPKRYV